MLPEIENCLKNEMKIVWADFYAKYSCFTQEEQSIIDHQMELMFQVSQYIRDGSISDDKFNELYYSGKEDPICEFLHPVFDCFKEWQNAQGLELHKNLYANTNRGPGNWFPLVTVDQRITTFEKYDDYVILYRGCNLDEYTSNTYRKRQSWTTDLSVARIFAFNHPPCHISRENRIVIKALVKKLDIFWVRPAESEMVLALNFSPESTEIAMTYADYLAQGRT